MIRIQNPSSTEKDWNSVPGIGNPRRRIRNPILSLIPSHEASYSIEKSTQGVANYQEIVLSEFYCKFIFPNAAEQYPNVELSRFKATVESRIILIAEQDHNKKYKRRGSTSLVCF